MGNLFSKKKQTYAEILEHIGLEISVLEEKRTDNELARKHFVGYLIIFSSILYIIVLFGDYLFFDYPKTFIDWCIRLSPVFLLPVCIWMIKALVVWFYGVRLDNSNRKLCILLKRRKQILDEVRENETYKVARDILDRFEKPAPIHDDNLQNHDINQNNGIIDETNLTPNLSQKHDQNIVRRRAASQQIFNSSLSSHMFADHSQPLQSFIASSRPKSSTMSNLNLPYLQYSPDKLSTSFLPAQVVPQQRNTLDKIVDYLLNDGPNHRYALICAKCHGHNGMALQEEFEFVTFYCCFCKTLNPARKRKQKPPQHEVKRSPPPMQLLKSASSDLHDAAFRNDYHATKYREIIDPETVSLPDEHIVLSASDSGNKNAIFDSSGEVQEVSTESIATQDDDIDADYEVLNDALADNEQFAK